MKLKLYNPSLKPIQQAQLQRVTIKRLKRRVWPNNLSVTFVEDTPPLLKEPKLNLK